MAKEDGECTKNRTRLAHGKVFLFSEWAICRTEERLLKGNYGLSALSLSWVFPAVGRQPCSPQLTVLCFPF